MQPGVNKNSDRNETGLNGKIRYENGQAVFLEKNRRNGD